MKVKPGLISSLVAMVLLFSVVISVPGNQEKEDPSAGSEDVD